MSSISSSTLKQYSSTLKHWWHFCQSKKINVYTFSIEWTMQFLMELFEGGASYGSLNCARSALALIISPNLGSNLELKRFFKGLYNLRPNRPKYSFTWDPSIVLSYLKDFYPNENLSLDKLTSKLVTLLALITAHRVQTLSFIELDNIHKNEAGFQIWISSHTKTSGLNKSQPILYVPYFLKDPRLCVAMTLDTYLEKTKDVRCGIPKLFLTTKKPYKAASTQSISRWIKNTLYQSGVDTKIFTAHSTRHSSTSVANRKGINIDLIKSTAGWTSRSNTFATFYNRPVVNHNSFALAILES